MKLNNQVAIITGAAAGMGKAIAELYAQEGAKVLVSDLSQASAQSTVDLITKAGGQAIAVAADVSNESDVQNLVKTAVTHFGSVDILVNNAGIMDGFAPAATVSDALWEKVMAVNATGPMRTIRQVLPLFIEKGRGVILNIASIGGLQGSRAGAAYTASKHALVGLSKNVAYQYAKAGIRCNVIAPGGVNTSITSGMTPDPAGIELAMTGIASNIRMGEASEIASIALFLGSQDSSLVNGAVVVADAGWTAY